MESSDTSGILVSSSSTLDMESESLEEESSVEEVGESWDLGGVPESDAG